MVLKVVHGGQVSLPADAKKALAAVSQTTGVLVIADPDQGCVYTVSTADLVRSVSDTPKFMVIRLQNEAHGIWNIKISFDGRHLAICALRSIVFLTLEADASLPVKFLQPANFTADLTDFDWSFSSASKYAAVTSDGCLYIGDCNQRNRVEYRLSVTSCCWTLHSSTWLSCGHRSGSVSIISATTGHILHAWPEVFPCPVSVSSVINASVLLLAAHPPGGDIIVKILKLTDPLSGSSFQSVEDWFTGSPDPGCRIIRARIPDWDVVFLSTTTLTETSVLRLSRDSCSPVPALVSANDSEDNPLLLESVTNSIACPATSLAIDFSNVNLTRDKFGQAAALVLLLSQESKLDFFYVMDSENQSLEVKALVAGKALLKEAADNSTQRQIQSKSPAVAGLSPGSQGLSLRKSPSSAVTVPTSGGSDLARVDFQNSARLNSNVAKPGPSIDSLHSGSNLPSEKDSFSHASVVFQDFLPKTNLERAFVKGLQIIDDALQSCGQIRNLALDLDVDALLSETLSVQKRLRCLLESSTESTAHEFEQKLISAHGLFELARAEFKAHDLYMQEIRNLPLDGSLVNLRDSIRSYIADIGDNIDLLRIEVDRRRLNQSQRPLQLLYSTINQNAESIARLQGELDGLSATFEEVLAARRNFRSACVKTPSKSTESCSKFDNFRIHLRDDICRLRKKVPSVTTGEDDLWELSLNLDQFDLDSIEMMENSEQSVKSTEIGKFTFPDDDLCAIESIFSDISSTTEKSELVVDDGCRVETGPVSPVRTLESPDQRLSYGSPLNVESDRFHSAASPRSCSSSSALGVSQTSVEASFGFGSESHTIREMTSCESFGSQRDRQVLKEEVPEVTNEFEEFSGADSETNSETSQAFDAKSRSDIFDSIVAERRGSLPNSHSEDEIPTIIRAREPCPNIKASESDQVNSEITFPSRKLTVDPGSSITASTIVSSPIEPQPDNKSSDDTSTNEAPIIAPSRNEAETSPFFKPAFLFPRKDNAESSPEFPTSSKAFSVVSTKAQQGLSQGSDQSITGEKLPASEANTSPVFKPAFSFPSNGSVQNAPLFPTSSKAFSVVSLTKTPQSRCQGSDQSATGERLPASEANASPVHRPVFSFPRDGSVQNAPSFPTSSNAFSVPRTSSSLAQGTDTSESSSGHDSLSSADKSALRSRNSEEEPSNDAKPNAEPEVPAPTCPDSLPPTVLSSPDSSSPSAFDPATDENISNSPKVEILPPSAIPEDKTSLDSSGSGDSDAMAAAQIVSSAPSDEMSVLTSKPTIEEVAKNPDLASLESSSTGQLSASNLFAFAGQPTISTSPTFIQTESSKLSKASSNDLRGPSSFTQSLNELSTSVPPIIQDDAMDTRQSSDIASSLGSNWFGGGNDVSKPASNPFGANLLSDSATESVSGPLPKVQNPFTNPPSTPNSFKNVFGQSSSVLNSSSPFTNTFGQSASSQMSNPFAAAAVNANPFAASSSSSNIFASSSNVFAPSGSTAPSNNPFKSSGTTQPVFGQTNGLGNSGFRQPFGSTSLPGYVAANSGSASNAFGSASSSGISGNMTTPAFGSVSNPTSFASFGQSSGQSSTNSGSFGQTQFSFDTANFRSRRGEDD